MSSAQAYPTTTNGVHESTANRKLVNSWDDPDRAIMLAFLAAGVVYSVAIGFFCQQVEPLGEFRECPAPTRAVCLLRQKKLVQSPSFSNHLV